MWRQYLAAPVSGLALLMWAAALCLYFLPSILVFLRGCRRFYIILILNILLSPLQGALLRFVIPGWFVADPRAPLLTLFLAILVNLGPGWVLLLIWAVQPGRTDPRLAAVQNSKLYDALAALPLILWFAFSAAQLRPALVGDAALILSGKAGPYAWVQFFSLSASAAFDLLLVWLLVVRDKPVRKSRGLLPRLFGLVGTFLGVGILQFPVARLSLPMQIVAAALVGAGSLASFLVVWRLGRSFSIMPEARRLVTTGPYAWARHPLYTAEIVTVIGTAIQFAQPGAGLVAVAVVALLVIRSHFEEGVLAEAYPEYAAYRARTARFIPGVI